MLLLIALLLTGWFVVACCVVAVFHVAARGEQVLRRDREREREREPEPDVTVADQADPADAAGSGFALGRAVAR
jgi:hypothetical protein